MATPKHLRPMNEDRAYDTIKKHLEDGSGWWEGAPFRSDFVYCKNNRDYVIRFSYSGWETGPCAE